MTVSAPLSRPCSRAGESSPRQEREGDLAQRARLGAHAAHHPEAVDMSGSAKSQRRSSGMARRARANPSRASRAASTTSPPAPGTHQQVFIHSSSSMMRSRPALHVATLPRRSRNEKKRPGPRHRGARARRLRASADSGTGPRDREPPPHLPPRRAPPPRRPSGPLRRLGDAGAVRRDQRPSTAPSGRPPGLRRVSHGRARVTGPDAVATGRLAGDQRPASRGRWPAL
jgi:hypothetical protein